MWKAVVLSSLLFVVYAPVVVVLVVVVCCLMFLLQVLRANVFVVVVGKAVSKLRQEHATATEQIRKFSRKRPVILF